MDINDLTRFPLRTFFFDIEVIADEFPTASESKFPITSITIYDTETKKYYVWGVKRYDEYSCKDHLEGIAPEEIVYEYCADEKYLLVKFLKFWRKNFPDLITGWNSSTFDVPYIVGRIEKVLGEGKSNKLSPVDSIYGVEKVNKKFMNKYMDFTINGIAHVDYMFLYKTFTAGERESDALDYICWEEMGKGKLDYGDMSLTDLYHKDWNKFINYNIWDVKLMVLLDELKRYLEIAKFSAFSGFCNLDKAFGKTAIITGVLAKESLDEGKIIPTQSHAEKGKLDGGYVKQPKEGMVEGFLNFDANSLYPSNIITLNISPESKVAKVMKKNKEEIVLYHFKERRYITIKTTELKAYIVKHNLAMSANGVMFDQSKLSIAAKFCDTLYTKRKKVKSEMFLLEKDQRKFDKTTEEYAKLDIQIKQKDVEQYLYKILLNSTYGAFAEPHFALYDIDCASAITLTGQAMIKQGEKIINECLETEWNLDKKDRVVMIDTDSLGITIGDIMDKLNFDLIDHDGNLTPEFVEVENRIGDILNKKINEWAINKLNSKNPRYVFKRESVCPKAVWTGKKHYIMYIVNTEGVKVRKFKYKGLQIAKSSFSKEMKDLSKSIVEIIMLERNKKKADGKIYDFFEDFENYDANVIAQRGGIKVLTEWEEKNKNLPLKSLKGTFQAKYAIYHNELLKILGLTNKYRKIENGAKMKMIFVKENQYGIPGVAFQDSFPPEFNLGVDYEKMFFKAIIKSIEPIYEAVGWNVPHPRIQHENTIAELFG
jgi:DNA polymerase elongation subunit (family B)